jgi:DNA-binding transcriptional MerR regulator
MATEVKGGSYRIGTVAERLGVTTRTIRYYEELGLLGTVSDRSKGAHRLYDEATIARLQRVLQLRDLLGLSLEAIITIAEGQDARAALRNEWESDPSDEDRLRILDQARSLLERQLALVQARQKTLSQFAAEIKGTLRQVEERRAEFAQATAKR